MNPSRAQVAPKKAAAGYRATKPKNLKKKSSSAATPETVVNKLRVHAKKIRGKCEDCELRTKARRRQYHAVRAGRRLPGDGGLKLERFVVVHLGFAF